MAQQIATRRQRLEDPILGPARRERLSARRRGWKHPEQVKAAIRAAHRTEEARAAASQRSKKWHASLTLEQRVAHYKATRKGDKPSRLEIAVAALLTGLGVAYEAQCYIAPYCADFRIAGTALLVECDGEYYHGSETAKARDKRRDEYLNSKGFKVLRLPGRLITSGGALEVLKEAIAREDVAV